MEKLIGFSSPVKENGRTTYFTIVLSPEVHSEYESFFLNYVKKMKALFNKNPYVFHKSLRAAKYYINVSRALNLLHMVLKPENCQRVYSYDCVFKIPHEEFTDLSLQYERREIPVPGESCFNYEPSRVEKVTETTNLNHWKNGEWTDFKDILKESEYLKNEHYLKDDSKLTVEKILVIMTSGTPIKAKRSLEAFIIPLIPIKFS